MHSRRDFLARCAAILAAGAVRPTDALPLIERAVKPPTKYFYGERIEQALQLGEARIYVRTLALGGGWELSSFTFKLEPARDGEMRFTSPPLDRAGIIEPYMDVVVGGVGRVRIDEAWQGTQVVHAGNIVSGGIALD